jgi:hypothetical protein
LDTTLILIGSGCLVCLMPLALYLMYLSYLNARTPPTLVSGPWDLGAVFLGLSGFILLLGPLLITVVDSTWRGYAFGGWAQLKTVGRREALAGSLMATGYLVILLGTVPILLRGRRRVTAMYNVATSTAEAALFAVLDQLGYTWRRVAGEVEIYVKRSAASSLPQESARVRIDLFPTTGHASLKWDGAWTSIRPEIETELPSALGVHGGSRNPVSGWMFTAALAVMIVMLLWLVVLIYLVVTPPGH